MWHVGDDELASEPDKTRYHGPGLENVLVQGPCTDVHGS
jgi:hypothetical protein